MSGIAQRLTKKNEQSVESTEDGRKLPAEAIQPAESGSLMGEVRGNDSQPNVGTFEYCL